MYDEILLLRNNFYIYFTYRVYTNHKNIPFISLHLYPVFLFYWLYMTNIIFVVSVIADWIPVQEGKCYIEISVSVLSKHVFIPSCFRLFLIICIYGHCKQIQGENAWYTSVCKWTSVLNGVCTFNLTTSSAVTVPWYERTCTDIKLNKWKQSEMSVCFQKYPTAKPFNIRYQYVKL